MPKKPYPSQIAPTPPKRPKRIGDGSVIPKPKATPKKPSLMNMMETNPKRIGNAKVPKPRSMPQPPVGPKPQTLIGAARAAAIASQMGKGKMTPQNRRPAPKESQQDLPSRQGRMPSPPPNVPPTGIMGSTQQQRQEARNAALKQMGKKAMRKKQG